MAEIGVIRVAWVVRAVAEVGIPPPRGPFLKHTCTQPVLLAVLCLTRHEDWTSCETAVRLREHAGRHTALGIEMAPDYTML